MGGGGEGQEAPLSMGAKNLIKFTNYFTKSGVGMPRTRRVTGRRRVDEEEKEVVEFFPTNTTTTTCAASTQDC